MFITQHLIYEFARWSTSLVAIKTRKSLRVVSKKKASYIRVEHGFSHVQDTCCWLSAVEIIHTRLSMRTFRPRAYTSPIFPRLVENTRGTYVVPLHFFRIDEWRPPNPRRVPVQGKKGTSYGKMARMLTDCYLLLTLEFWKFLYSKLQY